MRYTATAVLAAAALALTACGSPEEEAAPGSGENAAPEEGQAQELLAEYGLDGLEPEEVVDRLDAEALEDRPTDLMASVRPNVLVVSDMNEGEEAELPLPEDSFYLSMAPYVDQTHECFNHSLTTCVGELRDEEITVTITDDADGTVLVEETGRTFDNGFAGYWLPADIDATLDVEYEDYSASTRISTGEDDPTCLTTLELA